MTSWKGVSGIHVLFMDTIRLLKECVRHRMCASWTPYDCWNSVSGTECVLHGHHTIAERVCQAQNVCFISTTDSFQNIFLSNKYVYWHYFIWQLSWLTSRWLASFIKPRRAINNVSVGRHNFLRAEDKHLQHLFWKRGVTGIISNGSAYRPISWTLC